MKSFSFPHATRWAGTAFIACVGLGVVSCSLPPRETWQRIQENGVLKAFFVPKRTGVGEDRTRRLAGADLSVDRAALGVEAGVPVAVLAGPPGHVYSPRTATRKLVDVKDFAPGETVLCPYTMKPFVVPGVLPPAVESLAVTPSFGPAAPGSKPAASEPVASEPVASEPVASEPVASEPVASESVASEPVASEPVASESVASEPVASESVASESVASESVASESVASEPVASESVASEPVASGPVASESVASESVASGSVVSGPVEPSALSRENPVVAGDPAVEEQASHQPIRPEADPAVTAPANSPPYGRWVPDQPGYVYSPFAAPHQLVDVTGIVSGTKVRCPFTNEIFRVPEIITARDLVAQSPEASAPAGPLSAEPATTLPVPTGSADLPVASTDRVAADAAALREGAAPLPGAPSPASPAPAKYGATSPGVAPPPPAPATVADSSAPRKEARPRPPVKSGPAPELPTARWVPGKPGLVQSPFGHSGQLVDVTGKPTGSKVVCPYSHKPFLVPRP